MMFVHYAQLTYSTRRAKQGIERQKEQLQSKSYLTSTYGFIAIRNANTRLCISKKVNYMFTLVRNIIFLQDSKVRTLATGWIPRQNFQISLQYMEKINKTHHVMYSCQIEDNQRKVRI